MVDDLRTDLRTVTVASQDTGLVVELSAAELARIYGRPVGAVERRVDRLLELRAQGRDSRREYALLFSWLERARDGSPSTRRQKQRRRPARRRVISSQAVRYR